MPNCVSDNNSTNRILGVDYGQTNVGLAIADLETKIAFAYKTLKNDKNFLQKMTEIIRNENIKVVVIGIPSYVNKKSVKCDGKQLGKWLKNDLRIKTIFRNEMFTTKMAQAKLIEKGARNIRYYDNQEAARIILQEWLDNI